MTACICLESDRFTDEIIYFRIPFTLYWIGEEIGFRFRLYRKEFCHVHNYLWRPI